MAWGPSTPFRGSSPWPGCVLAFWDGLAPAPKQQGSDSEALCGASEQKQAREARTLLWEIRLERCRELTGKTPQAAAADLQSAAWKVAICAHMKNRLMCSNGWPAEKLHMGVLHSVSHYVGETLAGNRPEAEKITLRLNARIKE